MWVPFGTHILRLYAGVVPEQNVGTIHESNPEHLLVFKAQRRDDPHVKSETPPSFLRLHAGTIQKSYLKHLMLFKAPCRDDSRVQSGTPPCSKAPRGDNPWVQSRTLPYISGPIRGLKINCIGRGKHSTHNIQHTKWRTLWLIDWPDGWVSENH